MLMFIANNKEIKTQQYLNATVRHETLCLSINTTIRDEIVSSEEFWGKKIIFGSFRRNRPVYF